MKTILVLTDFSQRADHAAHYALKLAQKIKANLLLCNIFPAPSGEPMSYQVALPVESYENLKEDSTNDLHQLACRLNKVLDANLQTNEFRPAIEHCSKPGPMGAALNEITSVRHILMAVISVHGAGGLSTFLLGDHASEIIEKANCPVLVVPYQVPFTDFKKISFATDLTHNGMDILHCLYGLTKYFDPEILITHVAGEKPDDIKRSVINDFFNQDSSGINYPKVYYKAIKNKSVTAGLDWVTENTDVDLLVLVHRKRNFFQKIFEGSITQKLADHLSKPMLVFPAPKVLETLPVF